ncbi:alpha/beta fold hydrolase [Halobacillus yeomjeoni]|uniref:esterase/lipase family protein n=1 Tax=Halobacillus yeomjeoni TaxID=311194 RepID=UPI001CD48CFC|nr:alpha/beta fold hydrolase [Halobacillus yeomjeoni]MCA0984316.1 alpha/beta fold hydrolase [Halobacillus yeomjeoni]
MKRLFVMALTSFLVLFFIPMDKSGAESSGDFMLKEGVPPVGANNPSCQPDESHPTPVVLVPGTFESMSENWSSLSPALKAEGYCVYALNYGVTTAGYSTGPIEDSAMELKVFIDNVLEHTGAEKVSLVGHSQGGMMPRYYLKFLDGKKKVDDLIGLVPSNHGTDGVGGFSSLTGTGAGLLTECTACRQQLTGSEFLTNLNQGDETPGDVSYTNVTTIYDEVVVPYTSAFLEESKQVSNITLQDYFPNDPVEHQFIAFDPNAYEFVFDALAYEGPADPVRAVSSIR